MSPSLTAPLYMLLVKARKIELANPWRGARDLHYSRYGFESHFPHRSATQVLNQAQARRGATFQTFFPSLTPRDSDCECPCAAGSSRRSSSQSSRGLDRHTCRRALTSSASTTTRCTAHLGLTMPAATPILLVDTSLQIELNAHVQRQSAPRVACDRYVLYMCLRCLLFRGLVVGRGSPVTHVPSAGAAPAASATLLRTRPTTIAPPRRSTCTLHPATIARY